MRVIVVGAGGHGQVVADILRTAAGAGAPARFAGYVDDAATRFGDDGVLGPVATLSRQPHDAVVVAIGDNERRARLADRLVQDGERLAIACHPCAVVADSASIGDGTMVCAGVIVGVGARVGRGVILNTACSVDHHSRIGDYAHIAPGVRMAGEVMVGERAFLGIGAIILPRVTIGDGAIVGAGAVVVRDVPPGTTVVGVPARAIQPVLQPASPAGVVNMSQGFAGQAGPPRRRRGKANTVASEAEPHVHKSRHSEAPPR